uniref:ankyrin-2-like n=1 Tax=Styela clava TaxID=7725 RepID=UPI001939589B|nr:ankyrin-2-like [Styela clava]
MRVTKVLVILMVSIYGVFGAVLPDSSESVYDGSMELAEGVYLEWKVEGDFILLRLDYMATGWIGIGFPKTTKAHGMKDSDIIMGWVNNNKGYVLDAYAKKNGVPEVDSTSDVEIISAKEEGGFTTMVFKRPIVAINKDDVTIEKGEIAIIWAYGNIGSLSETISGAEHHSQRGQARIALIPAENKVRPRGKIPIIETPLDPNTPTSVQKQKSVTPNEHGKVNTPVSPNKPGKPMSPITPGEPKTRGGIARSSKNIYITTPNEESKQEKDTTENQEKKNATEIIPSESDNVNSATTPGGYDKTVSPRKPNKHSSSKTSTPVLSEIQTKTAKGKSNKPKSPMPPNKTDKHKSHKSPGKAAKSPMTPSNKDALKGKPESAMTLIDLDKPKSPMTPDGPTKSKSKKTPRNKDASKGKPESAMTPTDLDTPKSPMTPGKPTKTNSPLPSSESSTPGVPTKSKSKKTPRNEDASKSEPESAMTPTDPVEPESSIPPSEPIESELPVTPNESVESESQTYPSDSQLEESQSPAQSGGYFRSKKLETPTPQIQRHMILRGGYRGLDQMYDDAMSKSTILDAERNIKFSWNYNDEYIVFEVSIPTRGWIGVGFAPGPNMAGADIFIAGIRRNGVYASDAFAYKNGKPSIDESQDVQVLRYLEKEGFTTVMFARKIDTTDEMDLKIDGTSKYVIWAYGRADMALKPREFYHGMNRGAKMLNLTDGSGGLPTNFPMAPLSTVPGRIK